MSSVDLTRIAPAYQSSGLRMLTRNGGIALILGGLSFVITNVLFSPLVDFDASFREVLTSPAFHNRMLAAAMTVAFLLLGSVGLYLHHWTLERGTTIRQLTFLLTFFGTAFVFANEWHQVFVLPDIARISPTAIDQFDAADDARRYQTGAVLAIMTFSLGWISFMTALLVAGKLNRLGPALVLAGFLLIPLVSAMVSPAWGGAAGSVAFCAGFGIMGTELIRSSASEPEASIPA